MLFMLQIAGGVILALGGVWALFGFIDWLDWRTSRITDEEAHRRNQETIAGRWPPRRYGSPPE